MPTPRSADGLPYGNPVAGGRVALRNPLGNEHRVLLEDAEREAEPQEQRHVLVRVEPRPVQELV